MCNCSSCGKMITGKRYPDGLCQGCYKYFRSGGIVHAIPAPGTIQRDAYGYVICHICGRSYRRLGSHVRESHSMTVEKYKEMFGLCRRSKTTEKMYSETMHNYSYENDMPQRLKISGASTRIQTGDTAMRKGKPVRLQEILDKRNRKYNRKGT